MMDVPHVYPGGETERRELPKPKLQVAQLAPILLTLLVLAARLFLKPSVPTERLLIHTYTHAYSDPGRTAATILQFKAGGRYVEHTGYLMDSGKGGLSFAPGDSNVVVVGTWDQRGATLTVRRERVARAVPYDGPDLDPMCRQSIVEYDLAGNGVREGRNIYRASSQFLATDWDADVAKAKSSGISCRRAQ